MVDNPPGQSTLPDEYPDEPLPDDAEQTFVGSEQLSLMDMQRDQLVIAERRATWRAFAAPLTSNAGAVISDPELVELAVEVVGVFADHQSHQGLTFAQIYSGLRRRGVRQAAATVNARLEHLHGEGFLEPYLPKVYQGRYVVRPAGLVGALASQRVAEHGGIDEMLLLLDRTRVALNMPNPDPVRVLRHLNACQHALMVFAMDLQRRVATGTSAELIQAGRQHDHSGYTKQVADLNDLVTSRFSGRFDLEEAGTALIEAEQFYRSQVRLAIEKVLAQGGTSLNFDVLTPNEYEDAAVGADVAQLAAVGTGLIADAPPVYVDVAAMLNALDQYKPQPRGRVRPPVAQTVATDPDPIAAWERAAEDARRHRRLGLEAMLAGEAEVDLTPAMQSSWDTALRLIVDAIALDADPQEPFVLDIAELLLVDPQAPVSYLHPARLIRTEILLSEGNMGLPGETIRRPSHDS
ncbi:MAG TPA: hypothetical protein VFQ77_13405 [Pseudonocardiaceae bacterium]|jgi:hypothetical protein|nr:hypothetical protein [Pseudonocardiaceae bacterium]